MISRFSVWTFFCCVFALFFVTNTARADGTFLSAPKRVDVLPDPARHLLYISSGAQVLRYNLQNGSFETPYTLTGSLVGMDISPDGNLLAVADNILENGMTGVFLVNLNSGTSRRVQWVPDSLETGTFSVAFTASGKLLTTSSFGGSGWINLRYVDTAMNVSTPLAQVRQDTMLCASADRSVIAFAESNTSDGAWGLYRDSTGEIVRRQWYTDGTSAFNYEIGTNRDGTQFAIPTYRGTYIYNSAYEKTRTFGIASSEGPMGVAYNPAQNVAYFPWAGSSQIRAYDTDTGVLLKTFEAESGFTHPGNHAFVNGRTRVSTDGALLVTTVEKGVRFWNLDGAPTPTATPTSTPLPTSTPAPTSTPTPTATSVPTATPIPTATAKPTPTPTTSPSVPRIAVVLSPSNPRTNDRITAYVAYTSRVPLTLRYEWYCGTKLLPEYSSSISLSRVGNGDKNDTVTVRVVPYVGSLRGQMATASVRVQNTPPILVDKTTKTSSGKPIEVVLPVVDSDDGDVLKFAFKVQPVGGVARIDARDGKFVLTYTPRSDWSGQEVLQIRVTDSSGASDDGIAAIGVEPPKTITSTPNSNTVAMIRGRTPIG